MKPILAVVCAVIRKGDLYLACQRSESMREPLRWEFPGGKVEMGESLSAALHREMDEELATKVTIRGILRASLEEKKDKVIKLHPLLATLLSDEFTLKEHRAQRWISAAEFGQLEWCEADLGILEILQESALEDTSWWRD